MNEATEIWRAIPSLPEYVASSHGRVMRLPYVATIPNGATRQYGGEPRHGVVHPKNYNRPTIHFRDRNYRVSRLVCEAFHGPSPFDGAVVMHMDDDQTNNKPDNLKWGSQKENLNTERFISLCKARTGEKSPYHVSMRKKQNEQMAANKNSA